MDCRKLSDTDFLDFLKSYDIVSLRETWLSEKHSEDLSIQLLKSIHVFGQNRAGVKRGRLSRGLSVYFRRN